MKFRKNDAGRSMMDMILYIGLIAVISAGGFKMYSDYSTKIKRIQTIDTIQDVREKINAIYFGRTSGDTNDVNKRLTDNGINTKVPRGSLAISVGTCIDIKLEKISKEDCIYFCMSELQSDCAGYYNTPNYSTAGQGTQEHDCVSECNKDGENNNVTFFLKRSNVVQ